MADLYQIRGTEVQAWQVDFTQDMPQWMTDAINAGTIYYQGGKNPYLTIEEPGYLERASLYDFITKTDTGHRVVRKEFFNNYYVKVPT